MLCLFADVAGNLTIDDKISQMLDYGRIGVPSVEGIYEKICLDGKVQSPDFLTTNLIVHEGLVSLSSFHFDDPKCVFCG